MDPDSLRHKASYELIQARAREERASLRRKPSRPEHAFPEFASLSRTGSREAGFAFQRQPSNGSLVESATPPADVSASPTSSRKTFSEHLTLESPGTLDYTTMHVPQADTTLLEQIGTTVPVSDDTSLSISTPRMWTLALVSALVGSSMNLLFSLRYPSVTLTPIISLLVMHPLGLLWDRTFKRHDDQQYSFSAAPGSTSPCEATSPGPRRASQMLPRPEGFWLRLRLWLAQGEWNSKEHTCVFVSSNVSFVFAFATDIIVEQVKFYDQEASVIYQILLILSTQLLGYSFAGFFQTFLVKPTSMIWPSNLIATSMLSTLHSRDDKPAGGWRISRWKFFVAIFSGAFCWYFLPGLLMPALSYFNVLTWFAPNNVVVANLFGVSSGLGLFPVTFDWSQIAYTFSPLITSFSAAMNVFASLVLIMWVIAPLFYYTNVFYSSYLPILSAAVFDSRGKPYDIQRILTPDRLFDSEAYHAYSPVYLPITYTLSYGIQFASMTAVLSHTICWHGRELKRQFASLSHRVSKTSYRPLSAEDGPHQNAHLDPRQPLLGNVDIHTQAMSKYDEVPLSWYLAIGSTMTFVAMGVVQYYPIHLPWWSILVALGICTILIVPIGIVMATTNIQISIYLASQIAAGFLFPGRGMANIIFVTYAYITSTQALKFAADLKLGHYMKIPPRILFNVQVVSTVVASLAQIGVLNWALGNIKNICTPEAVNGFTCPIARVHFNGSVLWGVIGPARFFGPGALYAPLNWAFLIGAVGPFIFWFLSGRERAHHLWSRVNLPVFFGSLSWIPPATGLNFSVWALICFIFNYVIHKRNREWHNKYNMILSAGLDAGTALSVLVIFFGVVYWGFADNFKWWGTEVYKQGCDWTACSFRRLGDGQTFGPDTWH